MIRHLSLIYVLLTINTNLFAAGAGMPQLDPTYWASQAFWLILVFSVLYVSIAKFYLPKIKKNLDDRENKIISAITRPKSPVASANANPKSKLGNCF